MKIIYVVKVLVLSKAYIMFLTIPPVWCIASWGKIVVASQLINHINQLLATHYGNEILRSPLEFHWSPLHTLVVSPNSISKKYITICTTSNLSSYDCVLRRLSRTNFKLVNYRNWIYYTYCLPLTCMILAKAVSTYRSLSHYLYNNGKNIIL